MEQGLWRAGLGGGSSSPAREGRRGRASKFLGSEGNLFRGSVSGDGDRGRGIGGVLWASGHGGPAMALRACSGEKPAFYRRSREGRSSWGDMC